MSNTSKPPSGSIFCVDLERERDQIQAGAGEHKPNHQSYDVAVIEFEDDGRYVNSAQAEGAAKLITRARQINKNGAIVVVFIHGWHHNAFWDIAKDEGDTHFAGFRQILKCLALREAERYFPGGSGRRVVGIYLGWNGDPLRFRWAKTRWLTYLSFHDRYATAKRIGDAEPIRKVIRTIIACTKDPINKAVRAAKPKGDSPLILIGHSMGALILESAFLALLEAKDKPLVRKGVSNFAKCVEIRRGRLRYCKENYSHYERSKTNQAGQGRQNLLFTTLIHFSNFRR